MELTGFNADIAVLVISACRHFGEPTLQGLVLGLLKTLKYHAPIPHLTKTFTEENA